jgi:hypothetical protein
MKTRAFGEFTMEYGDRATHEAELFGLLRQHGAITLTTHSQSSQDLADTPEDEERILAGLPFEGSSGGFDRTRRQILPNLKAIVHDAFERHQIRKRSGMDVGAGATGFMRNELLPSDAQSAWIELDVNPEANEVNRRTHFGSTVVEGSYLRLRDTGVSNLDCVTGLSSLDSTQHLPIALEEICAVLKSGAYVLLVQDVRPGIYSPLREIEDRGGSDPFTFGELPAALGTTINNIITMRTPDGDENVLELFRCWLGKMIDQTTGLELIENQCVTARIGNNQQLSRHYFANMLVQTNLKDSGRSFDEASAVVTVARKRE